MTSSSSSRRRAALAGALLALLALPGTSYAAWPDKPVKIVVPSSPGGSADTIARQVGERLGRALGQPVIIENRGGGGGNIATEAVAKSPADGYTVLLTGNNHTLNVSLFAKPPYKLDDFEPVIELTRGPSVFVVAPNSPYSTLSALVAKAKSEPDKLAFGSPGIGLPSHIAFEMFERGADVQLTHVPYKGSGPSLTDAMSGQVPVVSSTLAAAMPHLKSGKLKALAVTSAQRWPTLPDVPTVAETVPGFSHLTWLGLFVPKGTPEDVLARLHKEVAKIMAEAEVKATLEAQGTLAVGGSRADFKKMLETDFLANRALVQKAGLRPE
jgi:tripartite-type tricarboxylate transporter receptor subunit TctC